MPYYPKAYCDSTNAYFMQQSYIRHAEYPQDDDPKDWMAPSKPNPYAVWAQNQIASRLPPGVTPAPPPPAARQTGPRPFRPANRLDG
jgi:hypothetical protein